MGIIDLLKSVVISTGETNERTQQPVCHYFFLSLFTVENALVFFQTVRGPAPGASTVSNAAAFILSLSLHEERKETLTFLPRTIGKGVSERDSFSV